MEVLTVSRKIKEKIKLLEVGRSKLEDAAIEKSKAIAEYDKKLAITMLQIRLGKQVEFEGEKVKDIPATMIEKVAKGICWKERLEVEKAESLYKTITSKQQSIEAELNGYQSIYRYLDKTNG
jgi:hypothetical protein